MGDTLRRLAGPVAALSFTLLAGPALAQEPPPPPPPAPPAAAPPAPGPAPLDDTRFTDANTDRVILGSTAETHPKGTIFFSDYELLLLQIGYAFTDELQLQLTGVPPIIKNQPYYFEVGAKYNVYRSPSFRAALTGGVDMVTVGGTDTNTGPYFGGRLGAVAQVCFIDSCRASVSITGGGIITSGVNEVLPVYGSAGFVVGLSKLISILAEPELLGAVGTGAGNINGGAYFALGYGVRFSGENIGVDVTFIEPVATTSGSIDNPFILGYPFVAFTYRTDGDARSR